jgi:hypothetical protein
VVPVLKAVNFLACAVAGVALLGCGNNNGANAPVDNPPGPVPTPKPRSANGRKRNLDFSHPQKVQMGAPSGPGTAVGSKAPSGG